MFLCYNYVQFLKSWIKILKGFVKKKVTAIFYKLVKERLKFNPIPIKKYMVGFKEYELKKLKR